MSNSNSKFCMFFLNLVLGFKNRHAGANAQGHIRLKTCFWPTKLGGSVNRAPEPGFHNAVRDFVAFENFLNS
jgi:hypothetical protein